MIYTLKGWMKESDLEQVGTDHYHQGEELRVLVAWEGGPTLPVEEVSETEGEQNAE